MIINKQVSIVYQLYKPSPDLAHLINYYFLYESTIQFLGQEFALSDGNPGISFALNQPYFFKTFEQVDLPATTAFVCGAFTKGLYAEKDLVPQRMFGIKFTADGLYYLLQESLLGLGDKPVWHLDDLLGNQVVSLTEQIREAADMAQQIHILETYLRKKIQLAKQPDTKFRQAVLLIRQGRGQQRIEKIAQQLSVSYKWLERKFIQYTGTTPKDFSRLIRFIHTYFHYKKTGLTDLIEVAISNGYYDQNHFIKDFKYFTGYTPTQLQQAPVYDLASIMEPLSQAP